jgi:glycosyltransferase involved in cell wall biosynthesis
VKEYTEKDSRVKYIKNETNKKLPLSLNTGFAAARGELFTWTSDDNYYTPNAIEVMVQALQQHPQTGLVYTNYKTIDDDGNITGEKIFGDVNESMVTWLGAGACFLYQAQLHTELKGYDASAFLIEDYDFFIRALTKTRFHYINRTDLYYYRLHAGSLTSLYGFYNFDLQKIVIERQLTKLIPIASQRDKALWYRKFAIYYGVSKNNRSRMNHYLELLFSVSKSQTFITTFYITFRKIVTGIQISCVAFVKLLLLCAGRRKAS